jgi:hypothetical protein
MSSERQRDGETKKETKKKKINRERGKVREKEERDPQKTAREI